MFWAEVAKLVELLSSALDTDRYVSNLVWTLPSGIPSLVAK